MRGGAGLAERAGCRRGHAQRLLALDVHKQELNRLLEPFLWHTVIVSATEWENFFELRCAPNAQPEIRAAALLMLEAINASVPQTLDYGEWHTPLLQPDESVLDLETRRRVSAARCARVSYLTHQDLCGLRQSVLGKCAAKDESRLGYRKDFTR